MEHRTVTRRQALILTSMGVAGTVLAAQSGVAAAAPRLAPARQTTTLQAWVSRGQPQNELIAQLIDQYNNEAAGGSVQWQVQDITEDIEAKLAAAASAGGGFPDAYLGDDSLSWATRYIQTGWVLPLNPILDGLGFDWSDFAPGSRWQLNGVDYMLNYGPSGFLQYINVDHMREAGLSLNQSPPDDMATVVEWAQKLTKRDGSGNITRSGFLMTGSGLQPTVVWGHLLQSQGYALVGQDGRSTNFNNDAGRQAASFVLDLFNKYKVSDPNVSNRYKEWLTGNASIFWSGDWVVGSSLQQQGLNFDVWKMPTFNGRRASQASLESMMIFKQDDPSRNIEAGKLLKWFVAHLGQFDATIGDLAPTLSVQQSAEYQNRPAQKYLWPVADAYVNGYTFPQVSHPEQDLNYYGSPLLARNLDNVWLGKSTIQEGLDALDKDVQAVLAKAPLANFALV
jgi:ABC-type glycerol-3-phosphate transport system substrate-binding protein